MIYGLRIQHLRDRRRSYTSELFFISATAEALMKQWPLYFDNHTVVLRGKWVYQGEGENTVWFNNGVLVRDHYGSEYSYALTVSRLIDITEFAATQLASKQSSAGE